MRRFIGRPISHGLKTLKEAVDSAFEAYLADYENSIYCIGSVVGPHPFPLMVLDFQRVVGIEAREQFLEMTGNLPDVVEACVGGGSNAMGIFTAFLDDPVELIGVEPLGRGEALGDHAATMTYGSEGLIYGFKCYLLQNADGSPAPVYSCADAFFKLCRLEGIIPAIESAHAVAHALVKAREMKIARF